MIDLLTRAIKHPLDYLPVYKEQRIALNQQHEVAGNIHIFEFKLEKPTTWKTGQHALFRFPDDTKIDGKDWRPFSVASSPHENLIRIGTIVPEPHSDFKQKMLELEPGEQLLMNGPFGEFHAHQNAEQLVGIAGGIGITPLRAMLYDIAHGHIDCSIHLIYGAQNDAYTFKEDFATYQTMTNKITVDYVVTREETSAAIDNAANKFGNSATYCISGSPGMISGIRTSLKKKGVKKIINDPFKGY